MIRLYATQKNEFSFGKTNCRYPINNKKKIFFLAEMITKSEGAQLFSAALGQLKMKERLLRPNIPMAKRNNVEMAIKNSS